MDVVWESPRPPVADREDWDHHWDDFAAANELNPAQEYRRRLVLELLQSFGLPDRLLDIGSGSGELLVAAAARWPRAQLLGLELSESAVAQARGKLSTARFRRFDLLADAAPEAAEESWATHAVCSEVLEHVDDPVTLLRNARGWLSPGCLIVVTVPGGPMSAFDRHIGHRRHFVPRDLQAVMGAAGLEVLQVSAAGFPFFNIYRALVIAGGKRLIQEARTGGGGTPSPVLRSGMAVFRALFRLNRPRSRFGWQIVAVAREPVGARDLHQP
jgi:2-polyprenyl-3-methyl-5-hydroxy-6-metoxy-1,4-benzoquinol methylase